MNKEQKVAIVTGAASGIGRHCAIKYAQQGHKVVVSDIDIEGGEETVQQINKNGGEAIFVKTNVADPQECKTLVEKSIATFGRLDYACNNAGISGEENQTADYSLENWQKTLDINLSGVFYCMKYEIPAMLEAGQGAIVNMTSILGQVGFATAPAYVAAKHGVVGLTKTAALEYSQNGIRINAVGPGFIQTPMISDLEENEETRQMLVSLHPIGRLGKPEEVAELVVWLCSDQASFISGSYYPIDGGYLTR
jgi:NAD(P)-dependent dehydrogenase (short-subunit alcohol dehydrogenase family)